MLVTLVIIVRNVATCFVSNEVCACALPKLDDHTLRCTTRLRPRLVGAVQSERTERERTKDISHKENKVSLHHFSAVATPTAESLRTYLRITYGSQGCVHLLEQGDPHLVVSGVPHLTLSPPLSF